jgi:serine/threonine-protein kinase
VKVEDLVELPQGWAVVLEYVDGADLRDLITRGPVPPPALAELGIEVAGALAEAHAARDPESGRPLGFVHRDVKPENIRVTAAGACKLLDFGVAHVEFEDRASSATTRVFGSQGYLAPERLELRDVAAGDVFALGVVMAEALLGRRTGQGAITPERHAAWVAALHEELVGVVPPELAGLAAEMLAYDPERRPTASEVEHRLGTMRLPGPGLRQWAADAVPAVAVSKPDPTATVARLPPRWRSIPRLGAAGAVVACAVAFAALRGPSPEPEPVAPPVPVPSGAPTPLSPPGPVPTAAAPSSRPTSAPAPPAGDATSHGPPHAPHRAPATTPSEPPAEPAGTADPPVEGAASGGSTEGGPSPVPQTGSGRVRVIGGASIRLVGPSGAWPEGEVPAGTWRLEYSWGDGRVRTPSTPIVVPAGETVDVRCDEVSELCRW